MTVLLSAVGGLEGVISPPTNRELAVEVVIAKSFAEAEVSSSVAKLPVLRGLVCLTPLKDIGETREKVPPERVTSKVLEPEAGFTKYHRDNSVSASTEVETIAVNLVKATEL